MVLWEYGGRENTLNAMQRPGLISKWTNRFTTNRDEAREKSNVMSQFLKEEKILMGQLWTIFVVVIGILAPQSNAESTSSISTSGFASSVLPSIATDNLSSIADVTTSTNVVINTDASSTFGKFDLKIF